jgi:phosphopantothenate-cysteine ligase/phosphopantothenoylcysteine decarboxylase/phosphopantothenate--cysteine ligase
MRILVTAGNTQTPIDKVRCITNIFSGRTGTRIALEARERGHDVCLITSHPEVVEELSPAQVPEDFHWRVRPYRTFAHLQLLMESEITSHWFDAIIHVAAVSDYAVAGTYSLQDATTFDPKSQTFHSGGLRTRLVDAYNGKVKSNHKELWLRLVPTPKLIDQIRRPWGFKGLLVKFKLEVGATETELKQIAEKSRRHSDADLVVANAFEDREAWALIKKLTSGFTKVARHDLALQVIQAVERTHKCNNGKHDCRIADCKLQAKGKPHSREMLSRRSAKAR